MLGGTFFSAISQILLKQSANIKYSNPLREYLNWRVILAYFLFFGILLNTWCYTKVDMRYGPVIDTAAYVFVLLLSKVILKEKITRGKFIGNLIIIAGIHIHTAVCHRKHGGDIGYISTGLLDTDNIRHVLTECYNRLRSDRHACTSRYIVKNNRNLHSIGYRGKMCNQAVLSRFVIIRGYEKQSVRPVFLRLL